MVNSLLTADIEEALRPYVDDSTKLHHPSDKMKDTFMELQVQVFEQLDVIRYPKIQIEFIIICWKQMRIIKDYFLATHGRLPTPEDVIWCLGCYLGVDPRMLTFFLPKDSDETVKIAA